ncbi:MAG: M48 family metallopeptidase [Deltaproteobacteria bacterium]|nr:M48 family metallopeptidase [Deltaproteobacteria bacterium]
MDFFEEQDLARKRSFRLALLFGLAVVGVSVAVYGLGLVVYYWIATDATGVAYVVGEYDQVQQGGLSLWNPLVFVVTVGSTVLLIMLGSLYKVAQLRDGGAAVALALGGRRMDPDSTKLEERRLLNVVEEMAIASGIPVPDLYVLDNEVGINAFAAGNTTSDAVIGVTHGTLQLLRRAELQGVIGHEFSHLLNGDSRINLRAIGLLHGIFLLALIGRFILYGSRGSRREGAGAALVGLGLLAIGSIGVLFGRMIQSAISRQRELLADASAVQFTRDTDGLVGALKKIGGAQAHSYLKTPGADEASHIFFSDAIRRLRVFQGLFQTHPPIGDRIRNLEPHWDGELPEVALPEISEGMSSRPAPPAGQMSAFAEPPTEAAVSEGVAHIGSPLPEQIAYARSLHASLPELWIHAVHQAPMAQAMVFGLLLGQDEVLLGSEIRAVAELTDPQTTDLALRFHSEAGDRSSAQKIALIAMAMPTLRNLSPDEYRRFSQVIQALIESDRRVDLFEYTLSRMIQRHLGRHFDRVGPTPVKFRSLRALLPDIRVLLSTLARVGSRSEEEATQALRRGAQVLHLSGEHVQLLPAQECTLRDVDNALSRYDAATPTLKKSLMLACAATVMADDKVTDREAELIRAIGDAVDCPVPPFVASGDHHGDPQRL